MSGQRLYHHIRSLSEGLARRVVFITGDTFSSGTVDYFSQTGNPLLAKPFRLKGLNVRARQDMGDRRVIGIMRDIQ